jgi:hypothetical protein
MSLPRVCIIPSAFSFFVLVYGLCLNLLRLERNGKTKAAAAFVSVTFSPDGAAMLLDDGSANG